MKKIIKFITKMVICSLSLQLITPTLVQAENLESENASSVNNTDITIENHVYEGETVILNEKNYE